MIVEEAQFRKTARTGQLTQAGQAEDVLGDHRAAEQHPDVDAELGHHRGQRGAQRVPVGDPPFADPLGPCRADVVLAQDVQHAGPGQPGISGGRGQGHRDPRQDQVLGPARRAGE